jgi:hypothetical protein
MAYRDTIRFAAFALAFTISACAATPEAPEVAAVAVVQLPPAEPGTPEFHGARIGADTLRSRLDTDN